MNFTATPMKNEISSASGRVNKVKSNSTSKWTTAYEEPQEINSAEFEWKIWRSACTLELRAGEIVFGCLCKIESKNRLIPLFVTTSSALRTSSPEQLSGAVFNVNIQSKTFRIPLARDSVHNVWTSEDFNSSVVELSAKFAKECIRKPQDLLFLKIAEAHRFEKVLSFNNFENLDIV